MAALILVPGLGVSPRYFRPLVEALDGIETIAPDLRRFDTLERQANALREHAEAGSMFLGNSYGCQIIAELAVRDPDLVGRAIFVSPTVDRRARSVVKQAGRLLLDMTREQPSLVPLVVRDCLEAGPVRVVRMALAALSDQIERKVPALTGPLLVVRGGRDPMCPPEWAEELTRLAPHGQLEVVPGAAHAVHYTHPTELAALVRGFLQEPE
jgi:2-hydroxy-6-oxonona-2,4-dienedioate hydrolase